MMSRKDYEKFAAWCGTHRIGGRPLDEFIELLAEDNPRFDRVKFFMRVVEVAGPVSAGMRADQEQIREARYEEGL